VLEAHRVADLVYGFLEQALEELVLVGRLAVEFGRRRCSDTTAQRCDSLEPPKMKWCEVL